MFGTYLPLIEVLHECEVLFLRVFSFGIGTGASTALVKGIARAGKGIAEFIIGKERLQAKVGKSMYTKYLYW